MTHSLAFVDNTTAEHVAENGRTQVEAIAYLNQQRLHWLHSEGLHEATNRVASVDNDIADMLSRGSVDEALRFPRDARLEILELSIPPSIRETSAIPVTWALA